MFNGFDLSTITDAKFGSVQVKQIYYSSQLIWPTNAAKYLTIEIVDGGTLTLLDTTQTVGTHTISYSTDNGFTWTQVTTVHNQSVLIGTYAVGDKILLKGSETSYGDNTGFGTRINGTAKFDVYGNIMSLVYGDNFIGQTALPQDPIDPSNPQPWYESTFANLFDHSNVISAEDLVLPATTLTPRCYNYMFNGCTLLTNAPKILPATSLLHACYRAMFSGCTSLTTAPELLATTLADSCYHFMFDGCTSLTTAPELPATTLSNNCYQEMFSGCTSLNYIKCLATDITATGCTTDWVQNVASSGTFIRDTNMTSWTIGANGIPTNWTVVPPLSHDYSLDYLTFEAFEPTTFTFSTNDVQYSLDNGTTWTTLAANTASPQLAAGDKILWKQTGLTPTSTAGIGTFSATGNYKAYGNVMSLYYGDNFIGQTSLSGNNYAFRYLFSGNTKLVNAENLILPATTLANNCYQNMFQYCTSLTSAPVLPATTLASNCYSYMFRGCTSLTTAPDLLATTSAGSCYVYMFNGCTSLRYIKCLLSKYSLINTSYWVQNVAASGTFVKNPSTTNWSTGVHGIPSGWTTQDAT